jgi:hypothetical protein
MNRPKYLVDPKSMELAEHFLSSLEGDEPTEDNKWELAKAIQDAVEGWFDRGTGMQCMRCGAIYNGGDLNLCQSCAPPPVDNLHVAAGCEQFSSTPIKEGEQ